MRDGDGADENEIAIFVSGVTANNLPHEVLPCGLARRASTLAFSPSMSRFKHSIKLPFKVFLPTTAREMDDAVATEQNEAVRR